jgi:hypothetical protein
MTTHAIDPFGLTDRPSGLCAKLSGPTTIDSRAMLDVLLDAGKRLSGGHATCNESS